MSLRSVIEHQSFNDIFQGLNLKILSKKTQVLNRITENKQVINDKIRSVIINALQLHLPVEAE